MGADRAVLFVGTFLYNDKNPCLRGNVKATSHEQTDDTAPTTEERRFGERLSVRKVCVKTTW